MEIRLESGLPHQQVAVDALKGVFDGLFMGAPSAIYANPEIPQDDVKIRDNVRKMQDAIGLAPELKRTEFPLGYLPLDIKMETGTGKTYVYTHTIYELHKTCGFNKFIIAVPSLAIKAGTGEFIEDGFVLKHFSDARGYAADIEVCVLEAQKQKKKGRSYFPPAVEDFVKGSYMLSNRIYVLLVNMQLLKNGTMLTKNDYDTQVEGFSCPIDALAATRPIVIIDEPHRFARDNGAYKFIEERIKPQCVIRFGATFPIKSEGRRKNKVSRRDYRNLLYDLNACQAFNQGLIKGVTNEFFEPLSKKQEKVKLLRVSRGESATFQLISATQKTETTTLRPGDSLSVIHDAFQGITISRIGTTSVVFSNDTEKHQGEEMEVTAFMPNYQEQMVKLALQRHFEVERQNYARRFKIKTLALFFIDDIHSYRDGADGKEPYLRKMFEKQLKASIKDVLGKLRPDESDYKEYLEYSLANIDACHAGYFAEDNDATEDQIAEQVETILHGKKKLLEIKGGDGKLNVCRFLFSKWTLKEGWDNPNVFTITKLRSSGSEISKIQEVGRGLRLPVDETGSRISNEEFSLNYIVDFTERDFAEKLVKEVNVEIPNASVLTDVLIAEVAHKLGVNPNELLITLLSKKYIDFQKNVLPDNRDAFLAEYPDFAFGVKTGKIKTKNKEDERKVRIRPPQFDELKALWSRLNQRYALIYEKAVDELLPAAVEEIFEKNVFADVVLSSQKVSVKSDGTSMAVVSGGGVQYVVDNPIPYGLFLKRISRATNLPVALLDGAIRKYVAKYGMIAPEKFNERSASEFHNKFREWKNKNLQGLFRYKKSEAMITQTALTVEGGAPRAEITQGLIGRMIHEKEPCDKYLYDLYTYDSPLERDNLLAEDIEEVVVYGKIPQRSIAIPTITGGTFSPDFMYVVKKKGGEQELNVVVETKDVELETQLREEEQIKIKCAKIFFDNLKAEGYPVRFLPQLKKTKMKQIIIEALNG